MKKLTVKQKRFADNYIETGNARQSAINAGYSEKTSAETGYENLNKPHIARYIEGKLQGYSFDTDIRQKQALDYAIRVLHEQETEEVSHVVKKGDIENVEVVELHPKIKDRMDAAKFITNITSVVERNKLQNIKLEQEIKKLKKEIETETSTEDKLKEYFEKLDGEFIE